MRKKAIMSQFTKTPCSRMYSCGSLCYPRREQPPCRKHPLVLLRTLPSRFCVAALQCQHNPSLTITQQLCTLVVVVVVLVHFTEARVGFDLASLRTWLRPLRLRRGFGLFAARIGAGRISAHHAGVGAATRRRRKRHLVHLGFAPTASARIEVSAVLVAHLPSRAATPVLTAFNETAIPIYSNDAIVQLQAGDISHGILRIGPVEVLHKAKAAGSLRKPIKSHDNPLYISTTTKQLI
mmetsp:Transcript_55950/g.121787  ORF Transcript_55950/g.121787 Transcript_55950/m.121787 type:complete len:237 (-) Transcript_55950:626-1336(-)